MRKGKAWHLLANNTKVLWDGYFVESEIMKETLFISRGIKVETSRLIPSNTWNVIRVLTGGRILRVLKTRDAALTEILALTPRKLANIDDPALLIRNITKLNTWPEWKPNDPRT